MSLKWPEFHVDLNVAGPAPTISKALPSLSALALRRTEGSVTAMAEPRSPTYEDVQRNGAATYATAPSAADDG